MMFTKNLWVTLLLEIVLVFSVLLFCGWISTLADKNEHSGGGKV
jgi:hypothetical protein